MGKSGPGRGNDHRARMCVTRTKRWIVGSAAPGPAVRRPAGEGLRAAVGPQPPVILAEAMRRDPIVGLPPPFEVADPPLRIRKATVVRGRAPARAALPEGVVVPKRCAARLPRGEATE